MGATESRIVEDPANEDEEMDSTPKISLQVSGDLNSRLRGERENVQTLRPNTSAQAIKEAAYKKGFQDGKAAEAKAVEKQKSSFKGAVKDEHEQQEIVKKLIEDLNSKQFRAPLNPLQCSKEREACLACYREKDALQCKEVVDAFTNCAQKTTNEFVQKE